MKKHSSQSTVTVRFKHGGRFKMNGDGELVYVGGEGRTLD